MGRGTRQGRFAALSCYILVYGYIRDTALLSEDILYEMICHSSTTGEGENATAAVRITFDRSRKTKWYIYMLLVYTWTKSLGSSVVNLLLTLVSPERGCLTYGIYFRKIKRLLSTAVTSLLARNLEISVYDIHHIIYIYYTMYVYTYMYI